HVVASDGSKRDASDATGVGTRGERTESGAQPYRARSAAPHTRPWQGPMPTRVYSLAWRIDQERSRAASGTSSHRKTSVSGGGSSGDESRKARSSRVAYRRPASRARAS